MIAVGLTEYIPQATPRIETDTPFNSTGSGGPNCDSEAFIVVPDDAASATEALSTENSPGAKPGAVKGPPAVGVGLGLGDGDGLPVGVGDAGATGIKLAPVNKEIVPADSVVLGGERL